MTVARFKFEKVTREPVEREVETLSDLLAVLLEAGGYSGVTVFEIQTGERYFRVSASVMGETTGHHV